MWEGRSRFSSVCLGSSPPDKALWEGQKALQNVTLQTLEASKCSTRALGSNNSRLQCDGDSDSDDRT